jgi:hypothetical protein
MQDCADLSFIGEGKNAVLFATQPEPRTYLDELAHLEQEQFAKLLVKIHLVMYFTYHGLCKIIYHVI